MDDKIKNGLDNLHDFFTLIGKNTGIVYKQETSIESEVRYDFLKEIYGEDDVKLIMSQNSFLPERLSDIVVYNKIKDLLDAKKI